MNTIVALPTWNQRVSPVMDTAGQLMLLHLNDHQIVAKEIIQIPLLNFSNRVNFLLQQNINILICGAISCQLERTLDSSGIEIYPWIGGAVDDIINAYTAGTLFSDNFLLPGCARGRRRGRGPHHRKLAGCRRNKQFKEEQ